MVQQLSVQQHLRIPLTGLVRHNPHSHPIPHARTQGRSTTYTYKHSKVSLSIDEDLERTRPVSISQNARNARVISPCGYSPGFPHKHSLYGILVVYLLRYDVRSVSLYPDIYLQNSNITSHGYNLSSRPNICLGMHGHWYECHMLVSVSLKG
jgi:hypothetical protein